MPAVSVGEDELIPLNCDLKRDLKDLGFVENGSTPAPQSAHPPPYQWPCDRLYEGFELEQGTNTAITVLEKVGQNYRKPYQLPGHWKDRPLRHSDDTIYMIYKTLFVKTNGLLCYYGVGKLSETDPNHKTVLFLGRNVDLDGTLTEQEASDDQKKTVAEWLDKEVSDIKKWHTVVT